MSGEEKDTPVRSNVVEVDFTPPDLDAPTPTACCDPEGLRTDEPFCDGCPIADVVPITPIDDDLLYVAEVAKRLMVKSINSMTWDGFKTVLGYVLDDDDVSTALALMRNAVITVEFPMIDALHG